MEDVENEREVTIALYALYQYIGVSNPQYFELIYGLLLWVWLLCDESKGS